MHEELGKALKPGMSTMDIDRLGEKLIRSYGVFHLFKNTWLSGIDLCIGQ